MNKKQLLSSLFAVLILSACSKKDDEPFVNLSSELNIESPTASTVEGGYLYLNLFLTKALSKDVVLKGNFSIEGIAGYINNEDYKKEIEYSSDNGKTWQTETDKTMLRLKAENDRLKLRIPTLDDKLLEGTEKFNLIFEVTNIKTFKTLDFKSATAELTVNDNDFNPELSMETIADIEQNDLAFMGFEFNEDYSDYKIILIREFKSSLEKEIADGKYKKAVEDAMAAYKLLPKEIKVKRFYLTADTKSGIGGYVYNAGAKKGIDKWSHLMNIAFAFLDINSPTPVRIEYNENGVYGNVFAHELSHVNTLNIAKKQIVPNSKPTDCSNPETDLFIREGCLEKDVYLLEFYNKFYRTPVTNQPTHVSEYAASQLVEDIAESISHYCTQQTIPASTEASSGALQKINLAGQWDYFKNFKPEINKIFKLGLYTGGGNTEIYMRHVDSEGNKISCLDHKALNALAKERLNQ